MLSDSFYLPVSPLPVGVHILFTTRIGGVSDPPYHSLNVSLAVGDDVEAVDENRLRVMSHLPAVPRWLRQVHGNHVVAAEDIESDKTVADAAYTTRTGVICAIQCADCLPVMLYHADGSGVAAVHAGWRGLAAGIIEKTAAVMRAANPSPLLASLGPCISAAHYIVGDEVRQALRRNAGDDDAFQSVDNGKWRTDLSQLAAWRLQDSGITEVESIDLCTYTMHNSFFSARRNGTTGRQSALIYFMPKNGGC